MKIDENGQVLVTISTGVTVIPDHQFTLRELGITVINGDPGNDDKTIPELLKEIHKW